MIRLKEVRRSLMVRFDDVSLNSDMSLLDLQVQSILAKIKKWSAQNVFECKILLGISPLVHDPDVWKDTEKGRPFPARIKPLSDITAYYKACDQAGLPTSLPLITEHSSNDCRIEPASHGLVHIDHRLLTKETQELSIVTSCQLTKSKVFIPPFNKWNADTDEICRKHEIELIKYEDGWQSMECNTPSVPAVKVYCHSRAFCVSDFEDWIHDWIMAWMDRVSQEDKAQWHPIQ